MADKDRMTERAYASEGGSRPYDGEPSQTMKGLGMLSTRSSTIQERLNERIQFAEDQNVNLKKLERLDVLLKKNKEVAEILQLMREMNL